MALKTLQCCGNSSSPEQRSALRALHTLNPPKKNIRKFGGLSSIHSKHWRRVQGLMWGARGPFPPAAAVVSCVLCSTGKSNKIIKISCLLAKSLFITIYCKTYCNSYIANSSVAKPKLWHGRSPNHYGPMDPGIFGIAGKLLSLGEQLTA